MLILASQSPRRQELLSLITADFKIHVTDADESIEAGTSPHEAVMMLARRKAEAASEKYPDDIIIGADTVVALGTKILGKPRDKADAANMLRILAGKTHAVYTGVCIIKSGEETVFFETTEVTFSDMSESEILSYVETGEPLDKAGAYGIQGRAALFIPKISGDYYNVMGLPVSMLYKKLRGKSYI